MCRKSKKVYVWLLFICIIGAQLLSAPATKAASDVEVRYETVSDWKNEFSGKITIQNNSSKEIDQWKLEFDWDRKITCIWNAKLEKSDNNHYVISFVPWNKVVLPGESITFGFNGEQGNVSSGPSNCVVRDIYDQLAQQDRQWQQYLSLKSAEKFQKSYADGFAYLWSRFPSDEPYSVGYEIIEKNPVQKYIQARYQNVEFKTQDGLTLKGLFFPVKKAKGTIIMLHGYGSTAIWETAKLKYLLDNGYQIFSYNSRYWNFYKTPEKYVELMSNEVKDVGCAVNYLKTRHDVDKNKLGIYGFSYGACKAELFAPFSSEIRAVVFDGGYANISTYSSYYTWDSIANDVLRITREEYGDDPNAFSVGMLPSPYLNAMANLDKPALFIHGAKDSIPQSEVDALYNAAAGPKEKYIFPNSGHCEAMYTEDKADYENRVLTFLAKYF